MTNQSHGPETSTFRHPLLGYLDANSFDPGTRVDVRISADDGSEVEVALVRFLDGSPDPGVAPAPTQEFEDLRQVVRGSGQRSRVGSWFEASIEPGAFADCDRLEITLWILVSLVDLQSGGCVATLGRQGRSSPMLELGLSVEHKLEVRSQGDVIGTSSNNIDLMTWYSVAVAWGRDAVELRMIPQSPSGSHDPQPETARWPCPELPEAPDTIYLATNDPDAGGQFNGRVADLVVRGRDRGSGENGLVTAAWNFGAGVDGWAVPCSGPAGSVGRLVNGPDRLVPGPNWDPLDGTSPTAASHNAVHFRTDDVGDLGWAATTAIDLPGEAPSGVYAVRMRSEDEEMHIPFAVRDQARVGLLLPTLTYLSYANHRMFTGRGDLFGYISDHEIGATERERLVVDHPYLGRSIYDLHEDGSGVSRVSRARPLVNLEPAQLDWLGDGPHHFAADLYIVGWLERAGVEYSVLTDEDLHTEGAAALEGCKVLITGSHPEYWTTPMMRAQRVYLEAGGNLMYLGGNGYYWVTSLSQDQVMMEVRRGFAGSRAWTSQPGETVHAFDHAEGGMWRNRGYGPHQIGGVGMASQGWGASVGYKRLPDSFDPRVSTFFEGIGKDEHIGNFGFLADGAAGYEVDRLDMRWGSPRGALRLATSQTLSDHYQLTVEEVENMSPGYGGTKTPEVRADMVWFETTAGGQVFSTGSIAWASALGWNGGANNVDTVTTNVLRSFLGTARREG